LDPGRWLLGRFRLESTRDALLAQLRASKDPYAIADAADGLGRFVQDSTVVHELGTQLAKPRFFAAKRALAGALGRLGGADARAALVAAVEAPELRARRGIVRALGDFRHDRVAAAALEKAWKRERSYFVRAEIVGALMRTAGSECWPTLEAALSL